MTNVVVVVFVFSFFFMSSIPPAACGFFINMDLRSVIKAKNLYMTLLKYAHKKRNNFVRHFKESVLAIKNDVYFLKKYKTVNTEYLSRS